MQPQTPWPLDSGLVASLESLRGLAGVRAVRLLRWAGNGPCTCAGGALPGTSQVTVCATESGCGRLAQDRAELLVAFPETEAKASTLLCAYCYLTPTGTLALQSVPGTSALPPLGHERLLGLFLPVLMWAKASLERQTLEARLAELEKCSQTDLMMAMRVHEEEREWLAYEVHDRVAQTLASVFQQLQALETLAPSPEFRQKAVRASVLTREAIREARNIMNDLHPPVLDELGLAPLVEEELRRIGEDMGCRTKMELIPKVRLPRDVEVALYRIMHEALVNIRRHSQASEVVVSLEGTSNGVNFRVRDNGLGFDVAAALARKRVGGLMSLHRRAELAGGSCHLESWPGKGTTVSVWMPKLANTEGGKP